MNFKYKDTYISNSLDIKDLKGSVQKLIKKFEKTYPGSKIIYLTETGSKLHGTDGPNSDTDLKGIYIPPIKSYILEENVKILKLGKDEDIPSTKDDIDLELYPVSLLFKSLSTRMETNTLEILFSMFANKIVYKTKQSELIKENYQYFLFNKTEALVNFAMSQAAKYSVKGDRLQELEDAISFFDDLDISLKDSKTTTLNDIDLSPLLNGKKYTKITPLVGRDDYVKDYFEILSRKKILSTKIFEIKGFLRTIRKSYGKRANIAKENNGRDFKAFAHAIRAIKQAKELINTGFIKFPLTYAEELKKIKFNKTSTIIELTNQMDKEKEELDNMQECSILPEIADSNRINELKVMMYAKVLK